MQNKIMMFSLAALLLLLLVAGIVRAIRGWDANAKVTDNLMAAVGNAAPKLV